MDEDLNFEDSIEKLENIANDLEKGNLNLDESVEKFEQGIKLSKKCNEFLEKAEKKISILIKDENNEIIEEDFKKEND